MSDDEAAGTKLTPRAVSPGMFEEHMDGMRRGKSPEQGTSEPRSPINSIDLNSPPEQRPPPPELPQRPSTELPARE